MKKLKWFIITNLLTDKEYSDLCVSVIETKGRLKMIYKSDKERSTRLLDIYCSLREYTSFMKLFLPTNV